jgi:hypothetical protein
MAINAQNHHDNLHTCYCGASGCGKTVAVKMAGLVGEKAAIFDPYGDYVMGSLKSLSGLGNGRVVHHYKTRKTFVKYFVQAWKSGKGFAVAYKPEVSAEKLRDEAIWFANVIWAAGDGNKVLDVVFEELGKYTDTSGTDRSRIGEIASGGRKFGLIGHFVFQRPSEVPKTIIANSTRHYIGEQQAMVDARRWQDELDCPMAEVIELGKLNQKRVKHFLYKTRGIGNYVKKSYSF